ncbi:UNVERIFIED_CONTAM: Succinate dehydrogenase assembly factor 2, mitochondrial [Sesamum calycinum]|uniref:Succinate dehydrogenase assembly factor 2, mitochondrial n=1 Tax=Sesamum calycinum TaxID=2727403 RepID=A0AAW2SXE3_9LAMI
MASLRRALVSTVPRILSSSRTSAVASPSLHRPALGSFLRFYSSNESNQSVDIDLSNEESKRRLFNRLLYRSKQRGFLELDLVLGKWVEDHIHSMDESGIRSLVHVLDLPLPSYHLSGKSRPMEMADLSGPTPEAVKKNPVFMALREKVVSNLDNHAAPETRATPGQPWVRGWDDFKKGRDGPITGNQ